MSATSNRSSSKKRINYGSDSERSKRLNANLIERRRMQNINCGFSSLKKLLPPSDRKQTKAAILQQASQHILRLQRAIIQFKTENDSLRNSLKLNRSNFGSHFHYATKPYELPLNQSDFYPSPGKSIHRDSGARRNIESEVRMFEHVKKFKPKSPSEGSSYDLDVYHRLDSIPLTPPVSPLMDEKVLGTRSTSPSMFPSRQQTRYPSIDTILELEPPKKKRFNSLSDSLPRASRAPVDKQVGMTSPASYLTSEFLPSWEKGQENIYQRSHSDDGFHKDTEGSKQPQGDLQSIIDAIHIIEKTDNL